MNTRDYADAYGLKESTVRKYCQQGKIKAWKEGKVWKIPENEVPPLDENRIRMFLFCVLIYKSNPTNGIFALARCSDRIIPFVCRALVDKQYLCYQNDNFNAPILDNVVLSELGKDLLRENLEKVNFIKLLKDGSAFEVVLLLLRAIANFLGF